MSLRSRLLVLFAALALSPLVAVGVFEYVRSLQAVRRLLVAQTSDIARRAAASVDERLNLAEGDLRLLAGNSETARLFTDRARFDDAYLRDVWGVAGRWFEWASFRDSTGRELLRLGAGATSRDIDAPRLEGGRFLPVTASVIDPVTRRSLGIVVAAARMDTIAPRGLVDMHFGKAGYTVLVDAPTGRLLFDPIVDGAERGRRAIDQLRSDKSENVVTYTERDTDRVASVARVTSHPAIMVLSSSALPEFAAPLGDLRATNLLLVLLIGATAAVAFWLLSRRATQPLAALTDAADEIGGGNFTPRLPPRTHDDVGRLVGAFDAMVVHVRQMMTELEASRQMAAVGVFAGQISHEIRNPLTAIKLNLQSLERDARDGLMPADSRRTIEICLEEIQRLDRVVRGVLRLGRTRVANREPISMNLLIDGVLELVRPQLDAHRIVVSRVTLSGDDTVMADREELSGVFLNLLMNAFEAMQPSGGTIEVRTDIVEGSGRRVVRVTITDSGPGIAPELHARVFDPFFSTKPRGTGLGLALAARGVEEHGGRLVLGEPAGRMSGCTMIAELPLESEATA